MRKQIFAAIVGCNKAKTFSIVKPFYDTGIHTFVPHSFRSKKLPFIAASRTPVTACRFPMGAASGDGVLTL
ncbi:hypothetical protein BVI2075_640065 [Burkholderia vietnamiensis]|nr:hypothetical protein BVI2075_640065 [Burkholderia vietnamiensis]